MHIVTATALVLPCSILIACGRPKETRDDSSAPCDATSDTCPDGCCACSEAGTFTAFPWTLGAVDAADAGDVNGDGRTDVIVSDGTALATVLATACGGLEAQASVALGTPATSISAADRGDGTVGVLVLDEDSELTLRTGATLDVAHGSTIEKLESPGLVFSAHLDADPDDDAVVVESGFGSLLRVEDTGSDFVVHTVVTLPPGIERLQAGSLGGNERDELLFLGQGLAEVVSSGDFDFDQFSILSFGVHTAAAFGDIDGDGDGDVAIAADGAIELWVGDGDPTHPIVLEGATALGSTPLDVATVDLDGDGQLEIAALSSDGVLDLLGGLESGKLVRRTTLAVAKDAFRLFSGDVNGDTRGDLIVVAPTQVEVGVELTAP
jgi:hypothetical protein